MAPRKGSIPWNKGIPHSEETRAKISRLHKEAGRIPPSQKGYKHTEETKARISASLMGNDFAKGYKFTDEQRAHMSKALKGKKKSDDFRKKMSEVRGERHWNWQGGKTTENNMLRNGLEYREWRKAVFTRDNFTCVLCGDKKGGNLEADHIKRFSKYPELRFDTTNGRTLCKPCHRKTPTYGSKKEALAYA